MADEPSSPDVSPAVQQAFVDYLERIDRGDPISAEEFLQQHAAIAPELQSLLFANQKLASLAGSIVPAKDTAPKDASPTIPPSSVNAAALIGPAGLLKLPVMMGRYRIEKELGRGAMGAVYLAHDSELDRPVALKIPKFTGQENADLIARFLREARAAAVLAHPNICRVYDVSEHQGVRYIAMEYIEGKSLSSFVAAKNVQPKQAATVIRKLAQGLAEAHHRGILHRDLKPDNILVNKNGEPVLTDFGLARETAKGNAAATQDGVILGSPAYMPPEQAAGNLSDMGPTSDIYSLGVVLYELLTGDVPFRGSIVEVLASVLMKAPKTVRELKPDVDPGLAAICDKMMAKKPKDRYQSMQEVAQALGEWLKNPSAANASLKPMTVASLPATQTLSPKSTKAPVKPPAVPDRSPQQLEELATLVDMLLIHNDYPEAIRILEEIPDYQRTAKLRQLLGEAYALKETVEKLERKLEVALNHIDIPALKKCVAELLKIRPSHPRAREIKKALNDGGKKGVVKFLKATGNYHGGGLAWEWWQIAAAVGSIAGIFAAVLFAVIIYLKGSGELVQIEIDDPTAVVKIDGKTATISSTGLGEMRLTVGNHEYTVERNGETIVADGKYEVKKGDKTPLRITLLKPKPGASVAGTAPSKTPLPGDTPPLAVAPFDANQAKAHQEAWAKHLGVPVEFTNSLGMKFRLIPPGEFPMGITEEYHARTDAELAKHGADTQRFHEALKTETPQHKVRLSRAIYVGETEVTQQQYAAVMGQNPAHFAASGPGAATVKDQDTARHPVENLTWNDAAEFCAKLSERDGLAAAYARAGDEVTLAGGNGYRLPTEAEWEFSCRAGTTSVFWTGESHDDVYSAGWMIQNGGGHSHPVGELRANPFGLYDVHGNVFEYTQDGWDADTYRRSAAASPAVDPSGPASPGPARVFRGGNWRDYPYFGRSAARLSLHASEPSFNVGFRAVVTIDAVKQLLAKSTTTPPLAVAPFDATQAKAHQEAWAKHLGVPVEYTNSLGMKFRLIPPGEFTMGSTAEQIEAAYKLTGNDTHWQECLRSEGPQHRVRLTRPFYLAVDEVTQSQYAQIMGKNPSWYSPEGGGKAAVQGLDTANFPADHVSWNDAAEFCEKLNRQQPAPAAKAYRLPTEAEWEFAGRAGTTTKFWTGDSETDLASAAWMEPNSQRRPHAVGELAANPFGLHDLHGNVFEWVHDGWEETYFASFQKEPAVDPPGAESSSHVLRGGDWNDPAFGCLISSRDALPAGAQLDTLGFRISLDVTAVQASLQAAAKPAGNRPQLVSPKPGGIMPNGTPDRRTEYTWTFDWDDHPGATKYHLWVKGAKAKTAVIDRDNLSESRYQKKSTGYVHLNNIKNWLWKVRAFVDGEWQDWSEERRFDVADYSNAAAPPAAVAPFDAAQAKAHQEAWAKHLGVPVEYTNSIGMKFRLIPPGEFLMGSPDSDPDAQPDEKPQHKVRINEPYYFCTTEVTQKLWTDLMSSTPWKGKPYISEDVIAPATYVAWNEAVEFCQKLETKEAGQPQYRLPTEAEWEFACRAGTTTRYQTGDDTSELPKYGWNRLSVEKEGSLTPRAVGQKLPNPFGLHDMVGNVWEWCSDWYGADYYANSPSENPTGLASGREKPTRGGGFGSTEEASYRSACRGPAAVALRGEAIGFRIVLPVDAVQASLKAAVPPLAVAPFDASQAKAHQEAWAKHLGVPVAYANSVGMKFRLIPPGEFVMGSTPEEIEQNLAARDENDPFWPDLLKSEGPRHRVVISRPFYLGETEVTAAQYGAIVGTIPEAKDRMDPTDQKSPVGNVSWYEAAAFCNQLSDREKRPHSYEIADGKAQPSPGTGYRLAREAEWEFACRAGTTTTFFTGDSVDSLVDHVMFHATTAGRLVFPVAGKKPNPFGLYDILGNEWEWCEDWWDPKGYPVPDPAQPVVDPTGAASGEQKIYRGGDARTRGLRMRSGSRWSRDPAAGEDLIGFRVVLPVDVTDAALFAAGGSDAASGDVLWVDDALPPKAVPEGPNPWTFAGAPQPVHSGEKSVALTTRKHGDLIFNLADPPLVVPAGATIFAYVYLDRKNPPKEVMLQIYEGGNWEHRAYWGANLIKFGTDKTASRLSKGPLPKKGEWVRLEVSAADLGLAPNARITGLALTQYDGKAYWDTLGYSLKKETAAVETPAKSR